MAKRTIIAPQASRELRVTQVGDTDPTPLDQETPEHKRALNRFEERKELVTTADMVAGNPLYFRNYKWDVTNKAFPEDIDAALRFVTKFYPFTKAGKPLLVDEPRTEREVILCYEKQKIIKKLGLRYVVIEPFRSTLDGAAPIPASTLSDCLEQLGEI